MFAQRTRTLSIVVLVLVSSLYHSGYSAEPALAAASHEATPVELVEQIREEKIVDPAYPLSATRGSDEVVIETQRNPKLNDKEIKVQAILIAKTVLDRLPSSVLRAKVMFVAADRQSQVPVNRKELGLYRAGKLSEDDLLALVEISKEKPAEKDVSKEEKDIQNLPVVDGAEKYQRQTQLYRINELRRLGTNISPFQKMFDAQEKLVSTGTSEEVAKSAERLSTLLKAQEDMVKQAHAPILPPQNISHDDQSNQPNPSSKPWHKHPWKHSKFQNSNSTSNGPPNLFSRLQALKNPQ